MVFLMMFSIRVWFKIYHYFFRIVVLCSIQQLQMVKVIGCVTYDTFCVTKKKRILVFKMMSKHSM